MLVLGVAGLVALVVGGAVAVVARRWPRGDPAAAAVVALVAAGAAFAVLFLLVRSHTGFTFLDLYPARWAARHATSISTAALRVVTFLGSTAVALPLVVVIGVLEARRVPNRAIPPFLLLVEGGQLLLANLIKTLVDRDRPDLNRLVGFSAQSFPSGHATTAAATFAALALLLGRRRGPLARAAMAGTAAGLTVLVGCTRVLLGVHWTTDVLAGAALGWGWTALCSIAFAGRDFGLGSPIEQGLVVTRTSGPSTGSGAG